MSNMLFDHHLLNITNIALDSGWSLFFYPEFSKVILNKDNSKLVSGFEAELSSFFKLQKSFKAQVHVNGVHLLVSVDAQSKEVRLGTARLANEIFLLDQIESSLDSEVINLRESNSVYLAFKKHVELINSIPVSSHPGISKIVAAHGDLTPLEELESEEVLSRVKVITENLLKNVESYKPILFEKISDFALSLTARFALLRIHLLKFIAILPSLDYDKSGVEVKKILLESLERLLVDSRKARTNNLKGEMAALPLFWYSLFFTAYFVAKIFPAAPLAMLIRFSVRFMAKRFIAGETIELAEKNFAQLFATGRDVTLDQLGELVVSEKEADHYMKEVIKLVEGFSLHINRGEKNGAGILKAHVSIKVSALCSDFKPEAFDYTYALVAPRLKEILLKAKLNEVFINIDAEHYHYRDIVFKIYRKVLLETEDLRSFAHTGIVVQAYLRDAVFHLREVIALAKERGITMPVRLVKGAYWDAETVEATAHGHNAPEFLNKEETDIHFRQMVNEIFKAYPHLQICLASHNFSDHAFAFALREAKYPNLPAIEHQCLHMTYEALSTAMAKMGWAVRNYVPIGSLIVGMAYLVRRIMENSSQVGVLTIMRSHKKKVSLLSPLTIFKTNLDNNALAFDQTITNLDGAFFNTPPLRTYLDEERASIEEVLNDDSFLGTTFENAFSCGGDEISIFSPSEENKVVGKIHFATVEDTERALKVSDEAFYDGAWSNLDFSLKCTVMTKAALLMTIRRNELSRLIMHESGKALSEALADVDEAIDFINFYIRDQKSILDTTEVVGRGAAAVIAPWNFPLAIPCGMIVSSLIAGNTVILKSAEQTPLIAQVLVDLLHEAGVDKSSLIHLPGVGELVGEKLINSEEIATIVFTGSKAVGVHIAKCAAKRLYKNKKTGATYQVRVITEMGGKNAVIVTNNAELDETVSGILYSAFAHAGQKCSACSRVIVHNKVKEKLATRLSEAAMDLKVGKATDFSAFVNPMVNKDEKTRIISQVKEASNEAVQFGGKVYLDRSNEELPGSCVGPVVIELPFNQAIKKSSFAMKELFAPVIHIIGYDTAEQAIKIFNGTEYGLTGGIFSQSQDDIDFYTERMQCGNIYVNRPITGARVAIEPFGGFKLSGTGPKAGGVDYIRALSVEAHIGQSEHPAIKQSFEKGSDYLVDFAKVSGLYDASRVERAIRSIDEIISNFGPLFPGVFGTEKSQLQNLRQWLVNDFQTIINSPRDNRIIPGQLNYSHFDSFKSQCVYLSLGEKVTINSFANFIMAVACGLGVTVLCSNNKAYIWWKYLIDILVKNRFSPRNIECFYVNFDKMKKEDGQFVDVFIVDGDDSSYLKVVNYMEQFIGKKAMPKIIYGRDEVASSCFEMMRPYVNERSFAVNVMRHGAPMEVSL
ncbi:bifunctional proline dehydrogenase/L-glutamate gamma-semialdehyde dehydrogenase [Bacteriovorax sp. Seq25_V]|uniref:bifunctional proline dehydrogenase/L-glutamate gamma-semialdehyde dehydrogenase n=1 Tax=Bacteriovorax sp. Seq25_V TaxID=1201288 RepID=UPI000389E747|nr:bifunctional proline dehydrogenase/L-glutamate gamma-semialdehyde dehydrogenase [Bacteriovorax sp. Seq25_V]EQC48060.1 proline dehydrogenase family protein [Bacteriovorax sp. Seq25_V]